MEYKHFSFVPKNKDLKYIASWLEASGYKNSDGDVPKGNNAIYVNIGENAWGFVKPYSFFFTRKETNREDEYRAKTKAQVETTLTLLDKIMREKDISDTQKNIQKQLDDMSSYETSTTFNYGGIKFPGFVGKKAASKVYTPLPDYVKLSEGEIEKMSDKWIKTLTGEDMNRDLEDRGVYITRPSKQKAPKEKTQQNGIKEEDGKLNYELDWEFISGIAERMAQNKKKYPVGNWKKPMDVEKLKQSLLRHTIEIMKGEYSDDNRDFGHLEALALNSMMIVWQLKNK